jgi:hypothetical protein
VCLVKGEKTIVYDIFAVSGRKICHVIGRISYCFGYDIVIVQ